MADLTAKRSNFVSREIEAMQELVTLFAKFEQLDEEYTDMDYGNTITANDLAGHPHVSPTEVVNGIVAIRALATVYTSQRSNVTKLLP